LYFSHFAIFLDSSEVFAVIAVLVAFINFIKVLILGNGVGKVSILLAALKYIYIYLLKNFYFAG
jgi:hypothetical protein